MSTLWQVWALIIKNYPYFSPTKHALPPSLIYFRRLPPPLHLLRSSSLSPPPSSELRSSSGHTKRRRPSPSHTRPPFSSLFLKLELSLSLPYHLSSPTSLLRHCSPNSGGAAADFRRRGPPKTEPSLLPYSFLIPDGQTHPHAPSCSSSSSAFRRAQRRTAAVVVRFDHSLCTLRYFFFANLISHFSFLLGFSVLLTFGNGRFPAS